MPVWHKSRLSIIAVIALAFLFILVSNLQPLDQLPLLLRRMQHTSLIQSRPYRAPLLSCELPEKIEGRYCVFLHHGCSLKEHKRVVGDRPHLNSTITGVFPETASHGLYYCAKGIDDVALEDIRSDIAVDMVECTVSGSAIEPTEVVQLSEEELRGNGMLPLQAPLIRPDHPDRRKGDYFVFLRHGRSLEEHRRKVGSGANLNSTIHDVFPETASYGLSYYAIDVDDQSLEAIQADTAVDMIECDSRGYSIEAEDAEHLSAEELRSIRSQHRPYRAPLIWQEHPHHVKGSYSVTLHPGYTYEEHKRTVGPSPNFGETVYRISKAEADRGERYYVDGMSDAGLEAIRADLMVDMVKCMWPQWDATGGILALSKQIAL